MDMTPAEVRDAKMRDRAGKAYDKALTNTEAAPAPKAPASAPKRPAMVEEMLQDVKDAKDREKIKSMGYKKGGSVSARADGCAQRGKTRGKMV